MNEFVTRAEFVALYPTTDTPTQYVDKLYQHAKVTGTQQERLDAIAYFGGAATAADTGARARALLRVTQNGDFQAREANRTFVQIEYFGYLRRNPNDPPDNNFDGFNFWVNKLNQFKGDFLQAEMVKAFLSSLEYRAPLWAVNTILVTALNFDSRSVTSLQRQPAHPERDGSV